MPTVLVSAPYMLAPLDRFRPGLESLGLDLMVPEVHERLGEAELLGLAGSFDGTMCGDDLYTEAVLKACAPRLKVISKWGTGVDSIDAGACRELGISLYRTADAFTAPVADSVMGYMLAFARRQPWMDRAMKSGRWDKDPGHALEERVLGVVGVGHIGKAVARRARAFGMRVLGTDIIQIDRAFIEETGIEMTDLATLLGASDYVSVNCDLNPSSLHLLDGSALARMKPTAVLINTARGPIVEEAALIQALKEGAIAGAALDVFETEPLPASSPLRTMETVLLAPHNANSSPSAWERVHLTTINNLLQGLGISQAVPLSGIRS